MHPSHTDHLKGILARKRREVAARRRHAALYERAAGQSPPPPAALPGLQRPLDQALRVIGEIKFASPSKGSLRPRQPGQALWLAERYAAGGVAAISVLADAPGFGGTPLDLRRIHRAHTALPLLFKEFVLDEVQVMLARAAGASMVLLLAAALDDASLQRLVGCVRQWGMEPLVEAANAEELARALATPARLIGINARDLHSFRIDVALASELVQAIPAERVALWLSGVVDAQGFAQVASSRADAVLIGEGLMTAPDPAARLQAWMAAVRPDQP